MATYSGYRFLIDAFFDIASADVVANRIRRNGHSMRANDSDDFPLNADETREKELLLSMTPEARIAVAKMIERSRRTAIHDIACFFEGEISAGKITIFVDGEKLENSPYASFHFDFNCRLEGDNWPDID